MRVVAVIPARMASSRFPGKPMALIHGMPMIGHCYCRVRLCDALSDTYVATCDKEIFDYIESIGVAADSVIYILNTVMGFKEVTQDEDGIYDIYVHKLSSGFWGVTRSVNENGYNPSYIEIRNDYSGLSDYCDNLEDFRFGCDNLADFLFGCDNLVDFRFGL